MKFPFTKYRKIYYAFSGILCVAAVIALLFVGLTLGIDFAGGSVMEVYYEDDRPAIEEITEQIRDSGLQEFSIQPIGDNGVLIKTAETGDDVHKTILGALEGVETTQFESIGPTVGSELRNMSIIAILIASAIVIIYIAASFREKSGSVNSIKYGVVATGIAFFHDILIILGIFVALGYFYNVPITVPIVVALLTTLGYSLNDTVVIFDRIRENLHRQEKDNEEKKSSTNELERIINNSLNSVLGRSVNTSVTTLIVLFCLLFIVGGGLFYFVLALILGILLGTYSSIFLAGPLVLDWNTLTRKK